MSQVKVHPIASGFPLLLRGFRSGSEAGFSLLSAEAVARVLVQVHHAQNRPFQAFLGLLSLAVIKPIETGRMATAFFSEGAVHDANLNPGAGTILLDELLIDGFKPNALVVVTAVGALTQLAVAAQVGVVCFAANNEQTRQER